MSGETPREPDMDPRLDAALSRLPAPSADPGFRADLKQAFMSGDFADMAGADEGDEEIGGTGREAPIFSFRRRLAPALLGGLAAAAALVLLFGRSWFAPPSLGWEVVSGEGVVRLDDSLRTLSGASAEPLPVGARLETGSGQTLRIALDGYLFLELGEDTQLDLLDAEVAALGGSRFGLAADRGHLHVSTGPRFPGSCLVVGTPHAELECIGTVFAVDVYGGSNAGTCICCLEGTVQVNAKEVVPVLAGEGYFRPDGAPEGIPMADPPTDHVESLERFHEVERAFWDSRADR